MASACSGVVAFRERWETPCAHVLELMEQRASELTGRIAELEALRAELNILTARWRDLDPTACSPNSICHLIPPIA